MKTELEQFVAMLDRAGVDYIREGGPSGVTITVDARARGFWRGYSCSSAWLTFDREGQLTSMGATE